MRLGVLKYKFVQTVYDGMMARGIDVSEDVLYQFYPQIIRLIFSSYVKSLPEHIKGSLVVQLSTRNQRVAFINVAKMLVKDGLNSSVFDDVLLYVSKIVN